MSKKHRECECECKEPGYHVHNYCIYTGVEDCHRHVMRGVTSPARDTPGHRHDYEGVTSRDDGHTHDYCGSTDKPEYMCYGHIHHMDGKTCRADDHKHCYEGTTNRDQRSYRR